MLKVNETGPYPAPNIHPGAEESLYSSKKPLFSKLPHLDQLAYLVRATEGRVAGDHHSLDYMMWLFDFTALHQCKGSCSLAPAWARRSL